MVGLPGEFRQLMPLISEARSISREPSHKDIGVAVVGGGNMGTRHLEILKQTFGCRPIAVSERFQRLAELDKLGFETAGNLEEATRKGAQLAIIATDTGSHVADASRALANGLDLLVEKPLAVNSLDAGHLLDRADALGRSIFVACVLRFSKSLINFRESLSRLGQIHAAQIQCQSYLPDWRPSRPYLETYSSRPSEGGVLLDLIHEVDYAGWLYGWPSAVQARLRNLGRLGVIEEEAAELSWEAPTGCTISISLDYLTKPPRRQMRALGDHGTLVWDGISQSVNHLQDGHSSGGMESVQTREEMFADQTMAFLSGGNSDGSPSLATGEEGHKALAVCDAARLASKNKAEEKVAYR